MQTIRQFRLSLTCCSLHTTATFRAPVWFMTPLGRIIVAFGARASKSLWRMIPQERKLKIKTSIKRQRKFLYGAGVAGFSVGVVYYYSHLEFVPLTKRYRFMMYSHEEVCNLLYRELDYYSAQSDNDKISVAEKVTGTKSLPVSHPYFREVDSVVQQVKKSNPWCKELQSIQWNIAVIDNPDVVNAISLPTGDIIVYSGMIKACHNKDELGLILSHEMAHVILDHGVESISHSGLLSIFSIFVIACIWFFIPSDLASFLMHKFFQGTFELLTNSHYSRKLELEADKIGLLLASKACFEPEVAIKIWQHLPMFNQSDTMQEYFDTHPCNDRRYLTLQTLLPQASNLYGDCETISKEVTLFAHEMKKIMQKVELHG